MALRCSLLGHDYGEAEVEREREERGSEVVVTVQEYEECDRCGDRNVISENTEVTSLSAGTDADFSPHESDHQPASDGDADAVEPAPDAEFVDAETEPAAAAADEDDEFDVPTDENGDPVTDDGEILEDDDEPEPVDRDRDHGEWPDSDDVGPPVGSENEPTEWPDADEAADDDGLDPDDVLESDEEPVTDDAVVLENDSSSVGGSTESAAAADARSVTAEPPTGADSADADGAASRPEPAGDGSDAGTGIERAAAAETPGEIDGPREDVPTEFYCPRCEYVAAGDRPSLRAGDICPECRKGYLGERERR